MRCVIRLAGPLLILLSPSVGTASGLFSALFHDETLRVDYFHSGNASEESLSLDRLYRQGTWAGSRTHLVDDSSLGGYAVEVREETTDRLVFSRGFDSYFAEYQTTLKASKGHSRTYHETVLVPFPRRPVSISIVKRPRRGSAREIARWRVDPTSVDISQEPPRKHVTVIDQHISGGSHEKVDLAFIGEGYTAEEADLFEQDLERLTAAFLTHEPFASNKELFNIRGVLAPSNESGCDEPTRATFRDTAVGASFNSLGSPRYLLTEDNRQLRDIAANVPYDALIIMVNHDRYGGGGIYNLFCVLTAHNHWSPYLLVHEFGHSFAGLADEYYTSSVAYNEFYPPGVEPPEANITALMEPGNLKWKDLVADGTPLPSPWEKAEFDRIETANQATRAELSSQISEASRIGSPQIEIEQLKAEEEALARDHATIASSFLGKSKAAGTVGAFEGAGYSSQGLYRPMVDCVMFSKGLRPFCKVCERAVEQKIRRLAE